MIYNDQVIAYTSTGSIQIQKDEMETIQRNFIKLTFDLLGKNNIQMLSLFYGDTATLISNITVYFRQKLEKDELVKILNTKMTQ